MKWVTKKVLSVFWAISLVVSLILHWFSWGLCGAVSSSLIPMCEKSLVIVATVAVYGSLFVLPVLFTLPFKEVVFNTWRNFVLTTSPIFVILIGLIDFGLGGGYLPGSGALAGLTIIAIYTLYFLISLIIIAVTALRTRESRQAM